ncbi:MAG: P27 family phage terminase small subunit [Ruminococcus sp.]|nr:P27 family phage terminase small subunit [Ruminococcus sp.]MDE6677561.1 P27 family phage terminase small subunit [Ruminococcus sp.]
MARPAMSANVTAKHLTNEEKNSRLETETKLKGSSDRLKPSAHLTVSQRKIFKFIVSNLEQSGILSNLDNYVLSECSICIDRMQYIEKQVNDNPELLTDTSIMSTKDRYTKAFFRYCNELCLSPQARAKIANINLQKEENPLMELLND